MLSVSALFVSSVGIVVPPKSLASNYSVVNNQYKNGANDSNDHTIEIKAGHSGHSEGAK